ncbi:MAG: hypothetical protein H8E72_03675 [Candidatus Marinimicrobia bacterium]|nr:hypothetical protein [Candidatus Neomarinimicrobiota bacterium]
MSQNDAKALTQRLTTEMIKIGKFTIVERSEMKRLLDEQKFQYSGCVDVSCAVEIGKMLGAKSMVVGSVSKLGNTYSVDSRLIDVKTAESYVSSNITNHGDIGLLISEMAKMAYELCEVKIPNSIKNYEISQNKPTHYNSLPNKRIPQKNNYKTPKKKIVIDYGNYNFDKQIFEGISFRNSSITLIEGFLAIPRSGPTGLKLRLGNLQTSIFDSYSTISGELEVKFNFSYGFQFQIRDRLKTILTSTGSEINSTRIYSSINFWVRNMKKNIRFHYRDDFFSIKDADLNNVKFYELNYTNGFNSNWIGCEFKIGYVWKNDYFVDDSFLNEVPRSSIEDIFSYSTGLFLGINFLFISIP